MGGWLSRLTSRAGKNQSTHGANGFTLVEVMVAIVLLAFLLIGIVPVFMTGLSQASAVRMKSIATNIARERMEQIRQLDYRDITEVEDPDDPDLIRTLTDRFGDTVVPDDKRSMTFLVSYRVKPDRFDDDYDESQPKQVTVTVSWAGPPSGETSISTLIHHQFVGPKGAKLEVLPGDLNDPLTVFPMITKDSRIRYYLAENDWGLLFEDISRPSATILNTYVTFTFCAKNGARVQLLNEDGGHVLRARDDYGRRLYLDWEANADGALTGVWFEYDLGDFVAFNEDTGLIQSRLPDGYWELQAVAYSERGEPGNVWPLQVRMENGAYGGPARPTNFVAYPVVDNQTVVLYWTGGPELDRAYYVLQRSLDGENWEDVNRDSDDPAYPNVDPNTTRFIDYGSVAAEQHPFGPSPDDPTAANQYYYRLLPVDICNPPNQALDYVGAETRLPSEDAIEMPGSEPEPEPDPTLRYTVTIQNDSSETYIIELWNAETNLWTDCGELKKNNTLDINELKAGTYHIYASPSGGTPDDRPEWSATFPNDGSQVVLTITDKGHGKR